MKAEGTFFTHPCLFILRDKHLYFRANMCFFFFNLALISALSFHMDKNIKSEKVRKPISQELCSDKVENKKRQHDCHSQVCHVQYVPSPI